MDNMKCFSENNTQSINYHKVMNAVRYEVNPASTLGKFMGTKLNLLREVETGKINPDGIEYNNTKKGFHNLEKIYLTDSRIKSFIDSDGLIEGRAGELLKNIKVVGNEYETKIYFTKNVIADVYINFNRGSYLEMEKIALGENTGFTVQHFSNTYASEGFTFAIRTDDVWISVEPGDLSGTKGAGEVYVYAKCEDDKVYVDLASKYFDSSDILKIYRG